MLAHVCSDDSSCTRAGLKVVLNFSRRAPPQARVGPTNHEILGLGETELREENERHTSWNGDADRHWPTTMANE